MAKRADSLVGDAGTIAGLTMISRVLGLARDCVCAAIFGAGPVWDAFAFAFRIPNLFRRLFGEGALSAAFVPIFTEYLELRDPAEARDLAGRVAGSLAAVLIALVAVGEGVLLGLLHFGGPAPRWELALALTAVLLPYALLICLTALAGAALNSLRHFAAPAAAPIVLNLCWIAAAAVAARWVSPDARVQIYVVAGGILVAGVLQLALQAAALRARGWVVRPRAALRSPQVRRVAAGMAPVALGMAAFQLNVLLDSVIAISLAGPPGAEFALLGRSLSYPMALGANSVLYYSGRLMQLPLGVFGVAIATAAFPALSSLAARREWPAFSAALRRSLGMVLFIGLPSGVGLMVLRRPIIELLFERGAFTPPMTMRTSAALLAYAAGLWAYCALHVLTRAFYSLKAPGVPARVAGAMVGANLALNLTLVWTMAEAGLAAATAVCAALQVGLLTYLLGRRVRLELAALGMSALKTAVATAAMAVACRQALAWLPADGSLAVKALRVAAPTAAGGAVYLLAAAVTGSEELRQIARRLRGAARPKG